MKIFLILVKKIQIDKMWEPLRDGIGEFLYLCTCNGRLCNRNVVLITGFYDYDQVGTSVL